jgi:hypothetical protein
MEAFDRSMEQVMGWDQEMKSSAENVSKPTLAVGLARKFGTHIHNDATRARKIRRESVVTLS